MIYKILACTYFCFVIGTRLYAQTLSDVVMLNTPTYKQIKINGETYAQYKPYHNANYYDNILIITTTPDEITKLVISNFHKITGSKCFEFFSLFNPEINYTSFQTDSILKKNEIKAIVKIGWNKDFYNSGSTFYNSFNSYLNNTSWGSSTNNSGTICQAYIDFFDVDASNEPFVRIQARAHSSSSFSFKEKSLANSIFGNSLKGLVKYNIVKAK